LQLEEAKRIILDLDHKLQRQRAKTASIDNLLAAATTAAASGYTFPPYVG
jgi:hypothetical protein